VPCKTWNIHFRRRWIGFLSRRKIQPMAISPRREDHGRGNGHKDFQGDGSLGALMRDARTVGRLVPAEEATLLLRAALGDESSQERLVAANLEKVVRLAATREGQGLSVPDLVQEGSIGLLQAIRTFADSGESDFSSFAEARIGAQMEAAISEEIAAVREGELLVTAATDYERAELVMRRTLLREPSVVELAEKLEWTVDRTRYIAQVVADARRRYDEEILAFIDPQAIELDDEEDGDRLELDG
jgi:DNA-directed RNA polymerase sigma subunit (sigma70/sigma32)